MNLSTGEITLILAGCVLVIGGIVHTFVILGRSRSEAT